MHMAWETFWKLAQGRRITTGGQLSAFRFHFANRIVEPKVAIGRPLMVVFEKPIKLVRIKTEDAYEHQPVCLRDIHGWPPSLSLSRFGHFPRPGEGEVIDARVVHPERIGDEPVLAIRGEFEDQEAACAIVGYPAILLECIARTLNHHAGEPFRSLSPLEILGVE